MSFKQLSSITYPDILRILNRPFIHYLLICAVGLIIYSNTLHAPFQWDENTYIRDNPIVRNLHYFLEPSTAKGFQYYDGVKSRYIGYLTFALNYRIHGFNVTGFHIFNIFVHLVNALLVYYIVILTFRTPFIINNSQIERYSREIALLTSLFFVSHPLQTEAVTYIFQRFASLVTMFYLFSLAMYIKGRLESQRPAETKDEIGGIKSRKRYPIVLYHFLAVVSAILAMKTKENAFTLPIVALLYELFFFKGPVKKRLLPLIPLLLTLFIVPVTLIGTGKPAGEIISQIKDPASLGFHGISRQDYLFTQFRVIVTYIRLLFLPIGQNLDHDYPIYHSFFDTGVFLSFLFLSSIICSGVYLFYRSRVKADLRLISFGIFWFFITLSVESSLIPIPMLIDEYRVYLPSVGAFVAVISGVFLLIQKFRHREVIHKRLLQSFILLLILFSVATYNRNSLWANSTGLWEDVVKKSPDGPRGHNNLGIAYKSKGLFDMAIEQYRIALELKPDYAEARLNLGVAYASKGLFDKAIEQYRNVLEQHPDYAEAHNNLGIAYKSKGLFDKAVEQYQRALELKPDYAEAHNNLGMAYASKGLLDRATEQYQAALGQNPYYAEAHLNLGVAYASKGSIDKAIEQYRIALELKPDFAVAETHYNLGNLYKSKGLIDKAIEQYRGALELKPDYAEAHNNLGIAYKSKGLIDKAIEQYRGALELKPDYAEAHLNLGVAYASKNLFDEAIEQYRRAVELKPDFAEAYNNLGVAYASKGLLDQAMKQYRKAISLKPDYVHAHLNMGIIFQKNGAVNAARREFEAVLRMKPDDYEARQLLNQMTK